MSNEYLSAIEDTLQKIVTADDSQYAEFFNMLRYHLGWTSARGESVLADTGKRVRPVLCLWACEAVGGNWRDALPAAAAIELIHNFSLIHDDIEDNSDARRGRETVWKVWGVAQAINAGDAMFVLAQQALDELPAHIALERHVAIQRAFHSGILKLTQGQYLDLAYERADQVTLDRYLKMVSGKTAALLAAGCEIGARIGTADPNLYCALEKYGEQLGIAFQISDDVLGIWGDPQITGKSARSDLLSRKKSYPVLLAMQTNAGAELRALYSKTAWTDQDLERVEKILERSRVREQATSDAESYARRAQAELDATQLENDAMLRLRDLIHQVVYREK